MSVENCIFYSNYSVRSFMFRCHLTTTHHIVHVLEHDGKFGGLLSLEAAVWWVRGQELLRLRHEHGRRGLVIVAALAVTTHADVVAVVVGAVTGGVVAWSAILLVVEGLLVHANALDFFFFLFDVGEDVFFEAFDFVELLFDQQPIVCLLDLLVDKQAPSLRVQPIVEERRIVIQLHGADSKAQPLHGILEFLRLLFGLRYLAIDERPQFALFLLLSLTLQILEHANLTIGAARCDGHALNHGENDCLLPRRENLFTFFGKFFFWDGFVFFTLNWFSFSFFFFWLGGSVSLSSFGF